MRKIGITLLMLFCFIATTKAQHEAINNKMGIGGHISQYQNDFGIGLNITSPYFANDKMAVRAKGNMMWLEHQNTEAEATWTPYSNAALGIVVIAAEINNFARLYGESGCIYIFPSPEFSSQSIEIGGYGTFGFEYIFDRCFSYYLEIGGMGTGATADKVAGKPIYSNGMTFSAGFRCQF